MSLRFDVSVATWLFWMSSFVLMTQWWMEMQKYNTCCNLLHKGVVSDCFIVRLITKPCSHWKAEACNVLAFPVPVPGC